MRFIDERLIGEHIGDLTFLLVMFYMRGDTKEVNGDVDLVYSEVTI
jgi:hypothetical protein